MNSLQTAAFHGLLLAPQWRAGAKMDHKPSVIPVSSSISITKSLSEIVFLVFYHAACHRYQVPLGSFWGKAAHLAVWLPAGQEVWIRPGGGAAPIFRDHPRQAYPTALLARWSSRLTGSLTITYHSDLGYSPSNGKLLFFGREFQSLIKPSRLGEHSNLRPAEEKKIQPSSPAA